MKSFGLTCLTATLVVGVSGCGVDTPRIEPTRGALRAYLGEIEGEVMPLYLGAKRMKLGGLVSGGRLNICMQGDDGAIVDKDVCLSEQPTRGYSTSMGELNPATGPCFGGPAMYGAYGSGGQALLAACVASSPISGVTDISGEKFPYSIATGQVYFFLDLGGSTALYTLEPMGDDAGAARQQPVATVNRPSASIAPPVRVIETLAPTIEQPASDVVATAPSPNDADATASVEVEAENAVDAAEAAAEASESQARAEREAADRLQIEEAQRVADLRARAAQEADARQLEQARREADGLKRLQDERARQLDAEDPVRK